MVSVNPASTDILPSVAAHLMLDGTDRLDLPAAKRYVIVLVDGLGWANLFDASAVAPILRAMPAQLLDVGLPSTTATSLASLMTGVFANQHGLVGYSFRTRPGFVMATMAWDDPSAKPGLTQQVQTWLERLGQHLPVAAVVPAVFADSGLTQAVLRGADFIGVPNERDWAGRVAQVAQVVATHALTYVYERGLDHVGHLRGVHSPAWVKRLASVDSFIAQLRLALPGETAILVTGDHGMVNVAPTHKVVVEDEPELAAGVDLIGGEARFRHLYTTDPDGVARRWQNWLGERGEVRCREQAWQWFGGQPATQQIVSRVGDVVVAALGDWAVLTLQRPKETTLVGMHGSLSQQERQVPLLKELT